MGEEGKKGGKRKKEKGTLGARPVFKSWKYTEKKKEKSNSGFYRCKGMKKKEKRGKEKERKKSPGNVAEYIFFYVLYYLLRIFLISCNKKEP